MLWVKMLASPGTRIASPYLYAHPLRPDAILADRPASKQNTTVKRQRTCPNPLNNSHLVQEIS